EPAADGSWRRVSASPTRWLLPAASGLLIGAAATAGFFLLRPATGTPAAVMRFGLATPAPAELAISDTRVDLAISPDGRLVAYRVVNDGASQIALRPADQLDGAVLRGAEGYQPFFSPDSQWLGFVTGGFQEVRKVSILGGSSVLLADVPSEVYGATWLDDDTIVVGTTDGLYRIPSGGGDAERLTTPEPADLGHGWPSAIPGADAVLFSIAASDDSGGLAVASLATGEVTRLGIAASGPRYVSSGHLLYGDADGSLRAVPFDTASLSVTGNPVPVVENVLFKRGSGAASFDVSRDGSLVYTPSTAGAPGQRTLVWVDREGVETSITDRPRAYTYARVSPDGTRLALDIRDEENDIWIYDLGLGTLERLTFDPGADQYVLWTPDGGSVVFSSPRGGAGRHLFRSKADGTGAAERLTTEESGGELRFPNAVSPDGTRLVYRAGVPERGDDLFVVSLDQDGATETLLGTEFVERNAELSPDGRWMAYQSDASGRFEIYVRPFPDVEAGRWQISPAGGTLPAWAPSGRELFYLAPDGRLMVVAVDVGGGFTRQVPAVLFDASAYYLGSFGRNFDVAPDGQRLVMVKPAPRSADQVQAAPIVFVVHFDEELKGRVR
ncbi:MAG TPA: hypothetical protein VLA23_09325, partial [Candidatus Limnocylindrales bacterium]|nr:hypothetical protein [Candidatus Limnocylindrales bacterium]